MALSPRGGTTSPERTSVSPACTSDSPACTSDSPTCTSDSPTCTSVPYGCTSDSSMCTSDSPACTSHSPVCTSVPYGCTSDSSVCTSDSPACTSRSSVCTSHSPTCTSVPSARTRLWHLSCSFSRLGSRSPGGCIRDESSPLVVRIGRQPVPPAQLVRFFRTDLSNLHGRRLLDGPGAPSGASRAPGRGGAGARGGLDP